MSLRFDSSGSQSMYIGGIFIECQGMWLLMDTDAIICCLYLH